eukprot:ANDGO_02945.mRNA.1 hypothetical protein
MDDYEEDFEEYENEEFEEYQETEVRHAPASLPSASRTTGAASLRAGALSSTSAAPVRSEILVRAPKKVTSASASRARAGDGDFERRRGLMRILEFDEVQYTLLDLPPLSQSDVLAMSSHVAFASAQIPDSNMRTIVDCQTEDIELCAFACQVPEDLRVSMASDGADRDLQYLMNQGGSVSMDAFLRAVLPIVSGMLEENDTTQAKKSYADIVAKKDTPKDLKRFLVGHENIIDGRLVQCLLPYPTPAQLLVAYSPTRFEFSDKRHVTLQRGVVCCYDVALISGSRGLTTTPVFILGCEDQISQICIVPGFPDLVFAGSCDGSLVMWDLSIAGVRSPDDDSDANSSSSNSNTTTTTNNKSFAVRQPCYSTDWKSDENHVAPIVKLCHIEDSPGSSRISTTIQLVSIDETGVVHLWVVVPVQDAVSESLTDFGMSLSGRYRISLMRKWKPFGDGALVSSEDSSRSVRVYDASLQSDSHGFAFATDVYGPVFASHSRGDVRRFLGGVSAVGRVADRLSFACTCLSFSPSIEDVCISGSSDGCLRLSSCRSRQPLHVWGLLSANSGAIPIALCWHSFRNSSFCVLLSSNELLLFDLSATIEDWRLPYAVLAVSDEHTGNARCLTTFIGHGGAVMLAVGFDSGITACVQWQASGKGVADLSDFSGVISKLLSTSSSAANF